MTHYTIPLTEDAEKVLTQLMVPECSRVVGGAYGIDGYTDGSNREKANIYGRQTADAMVREP